MYVIAYWRKDGEECTFFGPFPTKERAEEYAQSFEGNGHWVVANLVVPNCMRITFHQLY